MTITTRDPNRASHEARARGEENPSWATHRRMFGHLARAAGVATLAVEYGLVPDHVFPSQLDAMVTAYEWLLGRGAIRVAVTGDSCGATLALALRARDEGLQPSRLLEGSDTGRTAGEAYVVALWGTCPGTTVGNRLEILGYSL
jgi:hypothetical protein